MIIPSDIILKYPFDMINNQRYNSASIFNFRELSKGIMPLYRIELLTEKGNTDIKIQKHVLKKANQYLYKTIFDGEINNPQDLKKVLELTKVI